MSITKNGSVPKGSFFHQRSSRGSYCWLFGTTRKEDIPSTGFSAKGATYVENRTFSAGTEQHTSLPTNILHTLGKRTENTLFSTYPYQGGVEVTVVSIGVRARLGYGRVRFISILTIIRKSFRCCSSFRTCLDCIHINLGVHYQGYGKLCERE